jgi:tight adherence protein C
MQIELVVTLAAVFISVGLVSVTLGSFVMSRTSPEVKRLHAASAIGAGALHDRPVDWTRSAQSLRKPPGDKGGALQRRLVAAGWDDPNAATLYSLSQIALAALSALVPMAILGISTGWPVALVTAILGYMIPDVLVSKRVAKRRAAIQNGLPDALDLLVVCVEAGSSLDQAILKGSEELEIALPALAEELGTIASEIRAGKPRIEAFQSFAKRTGVEDVRALVAMLIQTDRFGTSIAQALRTHASTLRTKRRQRAEERAGKVGVKLVFPLVLCLLPALYVVCLGPVGVKMYRALF